MNENSETQAQSTLQTVLDFLVPFGRLLRSLEGTHPFTGWRKVVFFALPHTFFMFWMFSLIPYVGTLLYVIVLVPLSAFQHIKTKDVIGHEQFLIYLWYFVVVLLGFGGFWGFVGHTFLADMVAADIGWPVGSPFQTELAFYHLGFGVAGLLAIWLRGHMITGLVISKSIFWYGAAFVHIKDMIINNNYAPLNVGATVIGDILLPTIILTLLVLAQLQRNSLFLADKPIRASSMAGDAYNARGPRC